MLRILVELPNYISRGCSGGSGKETPLTTFMSLSPPRSRGEDPGGLQGGVQSHSHGLPPPGHGAVGRQAGAHRQAAAQDEGGRTQGPHLLPDGPLPGHPGGLPHPEKVRAPAVAEIVG